MRSKLTALNGIHPARLVVGWLLLAGILQGAPAAGTPSYPCEPAPAVRQALQKLSAPEDLRVPSAQRREERLAQIRRLLSQHPHDLFIHRRYQDSARGFMGANQDAVVEEYKGLLQKHPDDPVYLYLFGRLLISYRTNKARSYMEKALQRSPNFPWAHLGLVNVYQVPTYRDKAKLQTHLEKFMALCPSSPDAYQHLRSIEDTDLLRRAAAGLRSRLKQETDPHTLSEYSTLWRLEFRVQPATEHDQLRKQVAEDLKRLRELNLAGQYPWYQTLREGYKITNDEAGMRWAEDQLVQNFPHTWMAVHTVRDRWYSEHPYPQQGDPPEKQQAYSRALREASAEWVRRWPDDPGVWHSLFTAVSYLDDVPVTEVEAAVDGLLRSLEKSPDAFYSIPPTSILIADAYMRRGIRLDRVPDLVQRGFKEVELRNERDRRMDWYTPEQRKNFDSNTAYMYWKGWPLLVDAYLKSNQREKARECALRDGCLPEQEQAGRLRPQRAEALVRLLSGHLLGVYGASCRARPAQAGRAGVLSARAGLARQIPRTGSETGQPSCARRAAVEGARWDARGLADLVDAAGSVGQGRPAYRVGEEG